MPYPSRSMFEVVSDALLEWLAVYGYMVATGGAALLTVWAAIFIWAIRVGGAGEKPKRA